VTSVVFCASGVQISPSGFQPIQLGLGQHLHQLVAAQRGTFLLGNALDAIAALAEREVELDLGLHAGVGVVAAHLARAALAARGVAVERVGDAVEDGGLARAGGAGDQEQRAGRQQGEIHLLARGEGAEGLQAEFERFHSARASCSRRSTTRSSAACAAGSSATPVVSS